jgi:hypothetical protein
MKLRKQLLYIIISKLLCLLLIQNITAVKRTSDINKESDKTIITKNRKLAQIQHIIEIDSINYYKEIRINKNDDYIITFTENIIKEYSDNNILLTVLGNSITNFEITSNDFPLDDLFIKQFYFFNGYAFILNERIIDAKLQLQLKLNKFDTELIHIRTRPLNSDNQTIRYKELVEIILEKNDFEEECFLFDSNHDDNSTNDVYALQFLSYTKNIKGILKNGIEKEEIEINKESMTYVIKQIEYDEICFKLNKNNGEKGSLSFGLLNLNKTSDEFIPDTDNIVIYNNFSLIRDLPSQHYLP